MIKTLNVVLGQIGAAQLDPPAIVPTLNPGEVLATGYYVDQVTGLYYYYNADYDRWYGVTVAGLLYALEANPWVASPSAKIDLVAGDKLRFNLSFKYMGPALTARPFYAAVGDDKNPGETGSFAEWTDWNVTKSLSIPEKTTPTLITGLYIDLVVPSGSAWWDHEGEDGAAYCKIMDGAPKVGKTMTPYYCHVCHSVPAVGEFTNMVISKFEKVV